MNDRMKELYTQIELAAQDVLGEDTKVSISKLGDSGENFCFSVPLPTARIGTREFYNLEFRIWKRITSGEIDCDIIDPFSRINPSLHPHIRRRDGEMCCNLGDYISSMEKGDFVYAIQGAATIITSFNPHDAYQIIIGLIKCPRCQESTRELSEDRCCSCNSRVCYDCCTKCNVRNCYFTVCKDCEQEVFGEVICNTHDVDLLSKCSMPRCHIIKELDDLGLCECCNENRSCNWHHTICENNFGHRNIHRACKDCFVHSSTCKKCVADEKSGDYIRCESCRYLFLKSDYSADKRRDSGISKYCPSCLPNITKSRQRDKVKEMGRKEKLGKYIMEFGKERFVSNTTPFFEVVSSTDLIGVIRELGDNDEE